jgi:hypothetical protein
MTLKAILRREQQPERRVLAEVAERAARPVGVPEQAEQAERAVQRPARGAEEAVGRAARELGVAGREAQAAAPGVRSLGPVGSGS